MMDGKDVDVMRVHQNHSFLVEPTINRNLQSLRFRLLWKYVCN